jgi:hypothetical protein
MATVGASTARRSAVALVLAVVGAAFVLWPSSAGAVAVNSPAQCYAPGWVSSNMPTLYSRTGNLQNVSFQLVVLDGQGRIVGKSPFFLAVANRYGISYNPQLGGTWYNSVNYAPTFRTDVWVGKGNFTVWGVYNWDDGYGYYEQLPVNGWSSTQCLIK